MAEENPTRGSQRMQGALAHLGHALEKLTARNIVRRHHLEPALHRRKGGMSWAPLLKRPWEVWAATDCFTVEGATGHGLVTYDVLVVMALATRRVHVAGITPHPTTAFMPPCARQLRDPVDGVLLGNWYLIHARDTQCSPAFDGLRQVSGVAPIRLPPRRPHRNAYGERFIRSITEETLAQMSMRGERALSDAIHAYLRHEHTERNPQGLTKPLVTREEGGGSHTGPVMRRERLGGLRGYAHREAA